MSEEKVKSRGGRKAGDKVTFSSSDRVLPIGRPRLSTLDKADSKQKFTPV
jgi:hypothetical protein